MSNLRDSLAVHFQPQTGSEPVEWAVTDGLVGYEEAVAFMEARAEAIAAGQARELVWLVEHPPLYTAGTSAKDADLVEPDRFPVHRTGRGGQYTYHGPGQRVAYVMLDLQPPRAGPAPLRGGAGGLAHRAPSTPSTSAASAGRTGSASGCAGPTRARPRRTRSPPSASASGAG